MDEPFHLQLQRALDVLHRLLTLPLTQKWNLTSHPHLKTDRSQDRNNGWIHNRIPSRLGSVMYPEGLSPSGTFFRKVTCRKREWICYVPASIAFWGQKAVCWDSPKPLKVSGIFLTSLRLGDQTRCLLVCVILDSPNTTMGYKYWL